MANDKKDAAIVGVGQTNFAELYAKTDTPRDVHGLAAEALREALDDCGLQLSDLDGVICSRVDYGRMATVLGMQSPKVINSYEGSGRMSGVAVQTAAALIADGRADVIALVYGNNGRSSAYKYAGQDTASEVSKHDRLFGMTSPGAYVGMMWRRYQHLYGAPDGALAPIAINNRFHASRNPGAVMNSEITTEEYLAARWIADPLRLFDYCIINDGGVAMIMTSVARAKSLKKSPVRVAASAASGSLGNYYTATDLFYDPCQDVANKLYQQSGLRPEDMDCLEIYDNFTPIVAFSLEGFGHAERGTAWEWVQDGKLRYDRERPTNTCGGHTGESYMQGWSLHVEAVRQVRGEAGDRQVKDCRTAQYMCASPIVTSHILVRD
jgi:acetyl-CoA acetyltransferase